MKLPRLSSLSDEALSDGFSLWKIPMHISPTAIAPYSPSSSFKYPVPVISGLPSESLSGSTLSNIPAPGAFHLSPSSIFTRLNRNSGTSRKRRIIRDSTSPLANLSKNPPLPVTMPGTKLSPICNPFSAVSLSPTPNLKGVRSLVVLLRNILFPKARIIDSIC